MYSSTAVTKLMNPELWGKIEQLNLTLIQDRLVIKYKWSIERAENAIKHYKQFLYLTQTIGKPISPTSDIDEVWHQHILHTNKYAIDCQKLFGKFLHHFPTPSKWKQQKETQTIADNAFCCNHSDCCNDDPIIDELKNNHNQVSKKLSVSNNGELSHADCGEPAPGGCAPIGGSDDFCGGTTNDDYINRFVDFDNPEINKMVENVLYKDVSPLFFVN